MLSLTAWKLFNRSSGRRVEHSGGGRQQCIGTLIVTPVDSLTHSREAQGAGDINERSDIGIAV
jgi:hypothetical protein